MKKQWDDFQEIVFNSQFKSRRSQISQKTKIQKFSKTKCWRETNCPSIYRKEVLGKCLRRVSNDPRARNILALEKHLRRSTPATTR